jgi:type IV pilus assembly protein PilE
VDGGTPFYDLTISAVTTNSYTLQAKRINPGPQSQDDCGELTLSHTGKRDIVVDNGSNITAADCW